jgi:Phytanoyl-CoA dioxygenase (PhyH)
MISERQIDFFRLFGYVALPGFFDPEEVAVIEREYALGLAATRPLYCAAIGVRGQLSWSNMRPGTPFLAGALESDKLLAAARGVLDPQAVGVMTNGNSFSGTLTEWHADTSVPDFRAVKFVAYLDPIGAENGALRVLPGSHRSPWHEELLPIGVKKQLNVAGNPEAVQPDGARLAVPDIPAQVCVSRPGDVFAFDQRTWHASWNGSPNRRMCSFTYFGSPQNAAEREAVSAVSAQFAREARFRELRRQREWISSGTKPGSIPSRERQYSAEWLSNESGSELRARWIEQLQEWGMAPAPVTV